MFPVIAAFWIVSLSSDQYSLAQCLAICWASLLAARRICNFPSLGNRLYSARAVRLASMMGVISADLASNQSCDFRVFLPKVANAVRCMVSRRVARFSVVVSGLWGFQFALKPPSKQLHKVWLAHLADIQWATLFEIWPKIRYATHHGKRRIYNGFPEFWWCNRGIRGYTRVRKDIIVFIGVYRAYRGIQGCTGVYKGIHRYTAPEAYTEVYRPGRVYRSIQA